MYESPIYQGMTQLPESIEKWLIALPAPRLIGMIRTVHGQENVTGAGNHYTLVQMAAKSKEAAKAAEHFSTTGQLTAAQENDMNSKEIAAATGVQLVARYNELNPGAPVKKFASTERAREKVAEAEKAAIKAAKDAAKPPKAPKEPKPAKAPREPSGPRVKADYHIVWTGTEGTSKVGANSNRGATLAAIKAASTNKDGVTVKAKGAGILKSALDESLGYDTMGYLQKLVGHEHIVLTKQGTAPAAATDAGESGAANGEEAGAAV